MPARRLHEYAAEAALLPLWLFEESYDAVGDLAETIALILPPPLQASAIPLYRWIEERLLPLRKLDEIAQKEAIFACWRELDFRQRFVFNKLITGGFRVGVSQLSDIVRTPSWPTLALAREESRQRGTEGLMLKRRDSVYGVGRAKGSWWKWKVAPMTVDAVLVYAQRGHGKRASLYTDYTFAIWQASGMKKNWCHSPKLTRA